MIESDKDVSPQEISSPSSEGTDTLHKARQLVMPKHALSRASYMSCGINGEGHGFRYAEHQIPVLSGWSAAQPRLKESYKCSAACWQLSALLRRGYKFHRQAAAVQSHEGL